MNRQRYAMEFTRSSSRRACTREGFTLLELIVVITIIGLLGTLVVTKVVPVLFKANRTKIEADLRTIVEAAKQYWATTGSYPETLEELVNPQDGESGQELPGLEEYPKDPWGNEYLYELRDNKPYAISLGKDQQQGGEGDDEDIEHPKTESGY